MEVRETGPADCERIASILALVAEEDLLATEPPVDVAARAQLIRESLEAEDARGSWVLLDDRGEVVGSLGLQPAAAPGVLRLGAAILEGHRGGGGGRMLFERAYRWARRHPDVHKIELEVWPDNDRAIRFYEALGFEREGLRRDHYRRRDGSFRSAILMAIPARADALP